MVFWRFVVDLICVSILRLVVILGLVGILRICMLRLVDILMLIRYRGIHVLFGRVDNKVGDGAELGVVDIEVVCNYFHEVDSNVGCSSAGDLSHSFGLALAC